MPGLLRFAFLICFLKVLPKISNIMLFINNFLLFLWKVADFLEWTQIALMLRVEIYSRHYLYVGGQFIHFENLFGSQEGGGGEA